MGRLAALLLALSGSSALFAQSPAEQARHAEELLKSGKPEEAIRIYRELYRAFPDNPVLLLNLAIAEYTARNYPDAISHATAALKLNPNLLMAHLFLGASLLATAEFAPAIDHLERVVEGNPKEPNARSMLGEALLAVDRPRKALDNFRYAAELQPSNPKAWFGIGTACDALAHATAEKLKAEAAGSAYALAVEGDAHLARKRLGSAFAAYRASLRAGPAVPEVYAGLAQIYAETGHREWAAKAAELGRATSPAPGSEAARLYTEYLAFRSQARDAYARLRGLPPSLESSMHAARVLDRRGDYKGAASEWRKAVALAPDKADVKLALAWSLYRSRDYTPMLQITHELLKNTPDSVDANFLCGAALLNLQRAQDAIPYLTAALKADGRFAPAHAALGQALLQTGNARDAIAHLGDGLSTDADGSTHFQLLRAYQLTGNAELAKHAMVEYRRFLTSLEQTRAMEDGAELKPP